MSLARLCLALIVVALVGCNEDSENDNNKKFTPKPGNEKPVDENIARDYMKSATLSLAQTPTYLNEVPSNEISIAGTGTQSTYTIAYDFNSENSNSFSILKWKLSSQTSECGSGNNDVKFYLKTENKSQQIYSFMQYDLALNTPYVLEVQLPNLSCKGLEHTFDLQAWKGQKTSNPRIALSCENEVLGETSFFVGVDVGEVFTSVVGKEKFIGRNVFCGETFQAKHRDCETSYSSGKSNWSINWSSSQCVAKQGEEERSFNMEVDASSKNISVSCSTNSKTTFSDVFKNCTPAVLDYNLYSAE